MKLFAKLAISMVAVASMAQADVTLVGVDGGLTLLGLRVGANAGLTVGKRPVHTAPAYGTVVQTTTTTTTTNPCSYVCGPCEVVTAPACPAPKPACPAPKPACACPADPCAQ